MLAMFMLLACGGEKKQDANGGNAGGKKIKIGVTIYK